MVSSKILKQLNDKSTSERLIVFHREKRFVCIEKSNHKQDILIKRFYVRMGFNHYAVGTFGGFNKNGYFRLKIEDVEPFSHIPNSHYIATELVDVFESKKKYMKHLHAGLD